MASKPRVLLLGKIDHAHAAWADIATIAEVVSPKASDRAAFLEECKSGVFDDVGVAYRTFDSFKITGRIDKEVVGALPGLNFLCHNGAGYDQIDISACTEKGVKVSNTPTAVDDATADINIWLMIGALRNLSVSMKALREGKWRGNPLPSLGHDPQGKILGILGMGGIGRNMALKARAFDMKIRYHNRTRLSKDIEKECDAEYVDFDTLISESDVLSLNLPLNPKTRHIISTREFAKMKDSVIIINTARGAVMDEAALVEALNCGKVSSVGLDVFENEPSIHPGLLENPNVLLVPHMGTWTVETQTKMEEWCISNVKMAVLEARLRSIVPEQSSLA